MTKPKPSAAEIADQAATKAEARRARLARIEADPAQHFAAAVEALDPNDILPRDERKRVVDYLVVAADGYMLRQEFEARTPLPSEQRQKDKRIADLAAKLLKALGVDDPTPLAHGWPALPPPRSSQDELRAHFDRIAGSLPPGIELLLPELYRVAVERRGSAVTMVALERGRTLSVLLSDLVEASRRAAEAPLGRRGRPKDQPSAVADLVCEIIAIYDGVRRRHPDSGRPTGHGPILTGFVRACLQVIDPELAQERRTTNEMIRGHLSSWRKRKPEARKPTGELIAEAAQRLA
jgi:hypothetical protein